MPDWFLTRGDGRPARVFCFPYAGGDPRAYLDWQPLLDDCADIVAVCPPGKAHRAHEPLPDFVGLADQLAEAITAEVARDPRPVQLFGHSFGGLLGFEVARRLRDVPAVGHLTASGISAPSLLPSARVREMSALDGAEFAEALAFFGQFPPEVVADREVLDLLLPGLKADFELAVGYRYQPAPPLRIGVSVIAGAGDPHVGEPQLAPWAQECTEPPEHRRAPGGHFYFDPDPAPVVSLLRTHAEAATHVEVI
ncbi:thioesterase II family protein [Amycolatopsis magusensis]|uniref:Surfactin synthase thioesterase subunit n=1 Tax=Amycolatopsis magusensis TaxID=882444 RepID=A0ABS4PY37_9PSEU|nr:alpha/beta fold hydrolase [Amycolatopsis magusensis]MBP2184345.1 surfactin synthase thioesterase subunit [Amycolatopsis magusensis]